ncbi:restriction endonuclease, partial [Streptomyces sp. PGLac3x]
PARARRRGPARGRAAPGADALAATRTAPPVPVDEPAGPPTRAQEQAPVADAFPSGPQEPTLVAPFHDGRTAPQPDPAPPAPNAPQPNPPP